MEDFDDADTGFFEKEEIEALREIEKVICFAKDGKLNEYAYQNKCESDCDNGCTLIKYTPLEAVFDLDYENGYPYFSLNVHNMEEENKIYYFEYKNWNDDISFRVVMYPIGE